MGSSMYIAFLVPILLGVGLIRVPRHYENTVTLSNANEAFNFIKDFRNYQELNPLITSITISEESPLHQTAEYEELFETLPSFFTNRSVGKFKVDPEGKTIESNHSTCLIMGQYYCLTTNSFLRMTDNSLELKIEYECPFSMTPTCREEIVSQQSKIMKNLQGKFNAS